MKISAAQLKKIIMEELGKLEDTPKNMLYLVTTERRESLIGIYSSVELAREAIVADKEKLNYYQNYDIEAVMLDALDPEVELINP